MSYYIYNLPGFDINLFSAFSLMWTKSFFLYFVLYQTEKYRYTVTQEEKTKRNTAATKILIILHFWLEVKNAHFREQKTWHRSAVRREWSKYLETTSLLCGIFFKYVRKGDYWLFCKKKKPTAIINGKKAGWEMKNPKMIPKKLVVILLRAQKKGYLINGIFFNYRIPVNSNIYCVQNFKINCWFTNWESVLTRCPL
jgi:hypothetical protein